MSNQITACDLLMILSDENQELLTGGSDFELSGSNFANRLASLHGTTASGPSGSVGSSNALKNATATASQDFLGLGAPLPPTVGALGSARIPRDSSGYGGLGVGIGGPILAGGAGGIL